MAALLEIDGSQGEGGGQILRTSMSLAAITGTPVRISSIRAKRSKPGLMRQHLTAVRAVAQVSGGQLAGDELHSRELTFHPGTLRGGSFRFPVGTAGSTTLILQALLPVLLAAPEPTEVTIEGGTHNPMAPPVDFLDLAFLPLLRRMGAQIELRRERFGFFPAGGGRIVTSVKPSTLGSLTITERGRELQRSALAVVADLPGDIAVRELATLRKSITIPDDAARILQAEQGQGPGNVLIATLGFENVTEVFSALGEKSRSAESVAQAVVDDVHRYLASKAPVGEHLADQLVLPMSLGTGGEFVTTAASQHLTTNIDVIRKFLPVRILTAPKNNGHVVAVIK
jgi:RNA 3'-terminal phosphate cyclase (ATP)